MSTNIVDCNGDMIHYGQLIDFTWWDFIYGEVETHLTAKIRKRKYGDIFEFITDKYGRPTHFTHRLSALNWTSDDLLII